MRSPNDPILAWRCRIAATAAAATVALVACAWWAIAITPSPLPVISLGATDQAPAAPRSEPPALDTTVFEVALWNPPPAAEPPPPVLAERVEPLRLQLLGIVHTDDGLRAALYDPQDDRIHLVADGDTVGRVGVVRVSAEVVELADGRRTHTLRIRDDEPLPPALRQLEQRIRP